jgi:single-stranded DNA-specific DHH superfamily exonuclease
LSLLVVVDSGSALDYDVGCDVLVLDHHEFDSESLRSVNSRTQVVVSNQRLPDPEPMSGCQVAYEFFRHLYARMDTAIDTRMAQWVGISIISDVIDTKNPRNQFYVREAFESGTGIHPDLRRICSDMDRYFRGIYRSYVTYKIAPRINGISRAGCSGSLAYVISDAEPPRIPDWATAKRDEICAEAIARAKRLGGAAFSNLTGIDGAWRYTGVAAAKLSSATGRASLVFVVTDGEARGSFRRAAGNENYLEMAKHYVDAAGHPAAFGFSGALSDVKALVQALSETHAVVSGAQFSSAGVTNRDIGDIATWNGRVGGEDEIYISIDPSELSFLRSQGKVSIYRWRGAFEVRLLSVEFPRVPRVYAEMQRGLALYLK